MRRTVGSSGTAKIAISDRGPSCCDSIVQPERPGGAMKRTLKLAAFLALDLAAINFAAVAAAPKMPTFFARRDYPGLAPYFIQVGDTNGDGIRDIIVDGNGIFEVQLGNGDGSFRQGPTSHPVPGNDPYIFSFAVADFNGDGKIDLALVSGNSIIVSLGNGDGTFSTGLPYPVNDTQVDYVAIGDFNGDHILDIATAGATGVWLLTGKGGGGFNSPVLIASLSGGQDIATADFNEDGKQDLAVTLPFSGATGNGFAVLLGNGNGTFQTPQMFSTPLRPLAIAVGSLTKGGPPSIVVNATYTSNAYLYFGNGKGGFSGPRVVNLPNGGVSSVLIGDVNGDGLPDLVSDTGYVAYGLGSGYFATINYPIEAGGGQRNGVLADLRNIGRTDIITGGFDAISVLLNEGKGFMEDGIWTAVTGGAGWGAPG